jgi:uncharacterized peroxidase-related enzyme
LTSLPFIQKTAGTALFRRHQTPSQTEIIQMTADYKIALAPVSDDAAAGVAKDIMDATKAKLGFVPNMYRGMANSGGFLSTYIHGYNAFRQDSGFSPAEQEVVFLVISRANGCDYCTAAHSMIADKVSKLDPEALAAVRDGDIIPNEKLQALAVLTQRIFESRGLITKAEATAFLTAGFEEKQIMEIVLAVAVKTLSNYSNHLFHSQVDDAFATYAVGNTG